MVVEVAAEGGGAVGERPEDDDAPGAEEDRPVRGLVADRRAPDHADRLVGGLGDVDEILGEPVAHRRERAGDRGDEHVDVGIGDEGVEDLPSPPVADGVPAVVDGVRDPQVPRDPLPELLLGLGAEPGEPEAAAGTDVGHVGAGAAGDRIDDDAVAGRRLGPGEQLGGVGQLVEALDADDAGLAEGRVGDRVGARELAGVGAGHRPAFVGAADLDHDDRDAGARPRGRRPAAGGGRPRSPRRRRRWRRRRPGRRSSG